jgi:outer membrane receptor protein involved in Fe transport
VPVPSQKFGAWVQDDWRISNSLTLNLGLRYDLGHNIFANDIEFLPWQQAGRPDDKDNIQPRVGFAYQLNDSTVIRGGSGLYYGDALGGDQGFARGNVQIARSA